MQFDINKPPIKPGQEASLRNSIAAPASPDFASRLGAAFLGEMGERGRPRASAMELRSRTYQAPHVCNSSLAGDPIIDPIGFTSTSEGRHSRLDR